MKLQFEPNQQYQLDAIKTVVDVFEGQPKDKGGIVFGGQGELDLPGKQLSLEDASASGNTLVLSNEQLIKNVHAVQGQLDLPLAEVIDEDDVLTTESGEPNVTEDGDPLEASLGSSLMHGLNFSIEMETGTGKTYVYLRTIHELYQKYGWKKFIIVVPSVAIREGVLKNLDITREHFAELYNKPEMNYYVWDSKKTGQAREFAVNDTLQIMVVNIDSFSKAENIMNKDSDYGRPLDFIRATHPIVIIDEPQNMETEVRRKAINSLNPLFTLRYSATHKHVYNLLYRLTPVDAYNLGLVKKIEIHSVVSEDSYNGPYISVLSLERTSKRSSYTKIEVDASDKRGLQRKVVKAGPGVDLAQLTGRSVYEGFYIEAINHTENCVEFSNGKKVYVGQKDEALREEILKRQIELTIEDHFEKQQKLASQNIKVLSLFFIDKVANYREYTEAGWTKGKFARWFEELYEKVAAKYPGVIDDLTAEQVHNGYFAADKSGYWKDSKDTKGEGAKTKDDDTAYQLIMKDKERLLDINEPLRFIFSHSALREGWDNPNVFNICTLNETSSEMKKRQEIGRGLRLPVNANGERIYDENINVLTVIANESYEEFSRKLQTEITEETGVEFSKGNIKNRADRQKISFRKSVMLDPNFKELWERIKHKTTYHINIGPDKLVDEVVRRLEDMAIVPPQISDTRTLISHMGETFERKKQEGLDRASRSGVQHVPNILEEIQKRTHLTRKLIFEILDRADIFSYLALNPQQAVDGVSEAVIQIKQQLAVDGIKYERTGDVYDVRLFENEELESYLYNAMSKNGAVKAEQEDKTTYDYVVVDSDVEYQLMNVLENTDSVKFYTKLPGWFKIDTPLGTYNPDWAIVFEDDKKIYFVAETKGTDNLYDESLREHERGKIKAGRKHFEEIGMPYAAPVSSLQSALRKLI